MRRVLFLLMFSLFFFISPINLNAAYIELGSYLEKNQWGALEDILNDWKTGKITTDECALYGCYVLAAQEPSRVDRNEKARQLPARYKLNKKSIMEGPYFFIYQLYKIENALSPKALEEFRSSEWSDYKYFEEFMANPDIIQAIKKAIPEAGDIRIGKKFKYIHKIIVDVVENNYIPAETGLVVFYKIRFYLLEFETSKSFKQFLIKNNVSKSATTNLNNMAVDYLIKKIWHIEDKRVVDVKKLRPINDRKLINIINFYDFVMFKGYKLNKKDVSENQYFIVSGATPDEQTKFLNHFTTYLEKISPDSAGKHFLDVPSITAKITNWE